MSSDREKPRLRPIIPRPADERSERNLGRIARAAQKFGAAAFVAGLAGRYHAARHANAQYEKYIELVYNLQRYSQAEIVEIEEMIDYIAAETYLDRIAAARWLSIAYQDLADKGTVPAGVEGVQRAARIVVSSESG